MRNESKLSAHGIDVVREKVMSFGEAARYVGKLKGTTRVAIQTLHRWATKGCSGVVLETIFVGGSRCTSVDALQRFFEAVTSARERASVTVGPGVLVHSVAEGLGDVDAILRRSGIVDDHGGAS